MGADAVDTEIEAIAEEFELFSDWEERYAYLIEIGRALPELADDERSEAVKVRGCASQVWLIAEIRPEEPGKLYFRGDSDAHLVRGLIGLLLRIYSGRTPDEILAVDASAFVERLGLSGALSPQRSNGLYSMVERIRRDAAAHAQPG
jgi:cysteine desulfuration protein SufE